MELVAERKNRIQAKAATAEYFDLSETLSTKLELDQGQLANWDASARSWIRAANDSPVVSGRQKTVRSILDHINTTVPNKQDLYTSVTEAWRLCLETMEKIITGSSYSIEDGSVVVALVAWHLYPDLIVLGSRAKDIFQDDELIEPGGCVTVGLRSSSLSLAETSGVHWSLSLANLRYYGALKTTSRSLTNTPSGNERFTREEFTLVLIGVIIARWRAEATVSTDEAVSFIRTVICRLIELLQADHPLQLGSWTKACVEVLDEYEAVDNQVREIARKFVNLGLRNQSLFMPRPPSPTVEVVMPVRFSLFGLNTLRFANVLEEKADQKRFFMTSMERLTHASRGGQPPLKLLMLLERKAEDNTKKLLIYTKSELKDLETISPSQDSISINKQGGYYTANVKDSFTYARDQELYLWSDPPKPLWRYMKRHYPRHAITSSANEQETLRFAKLTVTSYFVLLETHYEYGNITPAVETIKIQQRQDIEDYIRHAKIARYELLHLIGDGPISGVLRMISRMWDFYENLPGSTISPDILSCTLMPLSRTLDSPMRMRPVKRPLTTKEVKRLLQKRPLSYFSGSITAFKLLVTFEAGVDIPGTLNADSNGLNWYYLIAISTDDSLYINPSTLGGMEHKASLELRRVRGNVGRPGMSLIGWFNTSSSTEWRQPRTDMWHVVNHNPFQGKLEDAFSGTSLHLNVTGWTREIDFRGNKSVSDGVFLEAVVSAHDKGAWLGDLSGVHLLGPRTRIVLAKEDCKGNTPTIGTMPPEDLVLVENWEELLNPHPVQPAVVMCHGNWQARITAAALSLKKGYRTLLFAGHSCWQCAFSHLDELKRIEAKDFRILEKSSHSSRDSYSYDWSSSSDNSEEDGEARIIPLTQKSSKTIVAQQTELGDQSIENISQEDPKRGHDSTLVDQDNAHDNPVDGLAKSIIEGLGHESDLDSLVSTPSVSISSSSPENIDDLNLDLEGLPYVPTVFIL